MNEERDKFLTKAIGECWHEPEDGYYDYSCVHCGIYGRTPKSVIIKRIDFSTWEVFGKLWEWAIKQEWWTDFCTMSLNEGEYFGGYRLPIVMQRLINPDRFADAVYKFLKGNPH